jgi:hypothetical protein
MTIFSRLHVLKISSHTRIQRSTQKGEYDKKNITPRREDDIQKNKMTKRCKEKRRYAVKA